MAKNIGMWLDSLNGVYKKNEDGTSYLDGGVGKTLNIEGAPNTGKSAIASGIYDAFRWYHGKGPNSLSYDNERQRTFVDMQEGISMTPGETMEERASGALKALVARDMAATENVNAILFDNFPPGLMPTISELASQYATEDRLVVSVNHLKVGPGVPVFSNTPWAQDTLRALSAKWIEAGKYGNREEIYVVDCVHQGRLNRLTPVKIAVDPGRVMNTALTNYLNLNDSSIISSHSRMKYLDFLPGLEFSDCYLDTLSGSRQFYRAVELALEYQALGPNQALSMNDIVFGVEGYGYNWQEILLKTRGAQGPGMREDIHYLSLPDLIRMAEGEYEPEFLKN